MSEIIVCKKDIAEGNIIPVYRGSSEGKKVEIKGLITKVNDNKIRILRKFHSNSEYILEQDCILEPRYFGTTTKEMVEVRLAQNIVCYGSKTKQYYEYYSKFSKADRGIKVIE